MTSATRPPAPRPRSWIQRLLVTILPARLAADMEAASRAWSLRCDECGAEQSIWDIGGVRWKAVGNPRRYRKCGACGRRSWHRMIEHRRA